MKQFVEATITKLRCQETDCKGARGHVLTIGNKHLLVRMNDSSITTFIMQIKSTKIECLEIEHFIHWGTQDFRNAAEMAAAYFHGYCSSNKNNGRAIPAIKIWLK